LNSDNHPNLCNQTIEILKQWGLGFHRPTHLLQIREERRNLAQVVAGGGSLGGGKAAAPVPATFCASCENKAAEEAAAGEELLRRNRDNGQRGNRWGVDRGEEWRRSAGAGRRLG